MTTRRTFLERAAALGVAIEDDGETLSVVAPEGKRFACVGVHWLDVHYDSRQRGPYPTKSEAYIALTEDMAAGLEDCDDPDCDSCGAVCENEEEA